VTNPLQRGLVTLVTCSLRTKKIHVTNVTNPLQRGLVPLVIWNLYQNNSMLQGLHAIFVRKFEFKTTFLCGNGSGGGVF
jgi:hypothetical protein